jgi:hypothetical protein
MIARAQSGVPLLLESPIVGESGREDSVVYSSWCRSGLPCLLLRRRDPGRMLHSGAIVCSETFGRFCVRSTVRYQEDCCM